MTDPESEVRKQETATKSYFRRYDPGLWEKLSGFSPEKQDEQWFKLTQTHLRAYEEGKIQDSDFIEEEKELIYLNYFFAEGTPLLDRNLAVKGATFDSEQQVVKFKTLGDVVNTLVVTQPKNILVAGVGISGKATLRTVLAKELLEAKLDKVVVSIDRDYEKVFPSPMQGDINIVEDVHGLDMVDGELKRFKGYDTLVYTLPTPKTYRQSLLNRGESWARTGKIDLTDPSRTAPDSMEQMLAEVAEELERTLGVGREWYKEHLVALKILRSQGIKVVLVDPTPFFENLYGFAREPEIDSASFLDLLKKRFGMQ